MNQRLAIVLVSLGVALEILAILFDSIALSVAGSTLFAVGVVAVVFVRGGGRGVQLAALVLGLSVSGCAGEMPLLSSVKDGERLEVTVPAAGDEAAIAAWRRRRDALALALNLQDCKEPGPGEWTIRTLPPPPPKPDGEPTKGTMVIAAPMRCGGAS